MLLSRDDLNFLKVDAPNFLGIFLLFPIFDAVAGVGLRQGYLLLLSDWIKLNIYSKEGDNTLDVFYVLKQFEFPLVLLLYITLPSH